MTKMEAKVQAMLNGITKVLPAKSSMLIPGEAARSQASIVTTLTGFLGLYQAVDQGEQSLTSARAALKTSADPIHQYLTTLAEGLRATFGKSSPQLAQFGLKPSSQPKAQTTESKALANVRRQSTRKARGIMGKNQRSAIPATSGLSFVVLGPDGQPVSSSAGNTAAPTSAATPTPPVK